MCRNQANITRRLIRQSSSAYDGPDGARESFKGASLKLNIMVKILTPLPTASANKMVYLCHSSEHLGYYVDNNRTPTMALN